MVRLKTYIPNQMIIYITANRSYHSSCTIGVKCFQKFYKLQTALFKDLDVCFFNVGCGDGWGTDSYISQSK